LRKSIGHTEGVAASLLHHARLPRKAGPASSLAAARFERWVEGAERAAKNRSIEIGAGWGIRPASLFQSSIINRKSSMFSSPSSERGDRLIAAF